MAASVAATAKRKGFRPSEISRVTQALSLAMEPRIVALDDDHHPAFLHPGRSALVALADEPAAKPDTVVLATLLESRDAHLRVSAGRVSEVIGAPLTGSLNSVPLPGSEDLVERLITLARPVSLAAAVERLDHLRHEHLREPTIPWRELVREVEGAWLPFVQRISPELARRYAHWLRVFRRRL